MSQVRDLSERAWAGELQGTMVHAGAGPVALEEYAADLAFVNAFSNVLVLEAPDGLCLIDTSSPFHAREVFAQVRSWKHARLHTAVYTHGHVDHVFGTQPFEQEAASRGWPKPIVLAHEGCAARFDRYKLTHGYNGVINQRQFGFPEPVFPPDFRYPDRAVGDHETVLFGSHRIELFHDKGETDDHLWAWLPRHKALYTGDLFIWASPNCGNPQKVQRYPREWAAALRKMDALGAEQLFPGHGPPIIGAARVRQALTESAELLETILEQTLALMNQGAKLNDILHAVKYPEHLLARPYLRAVYDDPEFIVHNVYRLYGGWGDGNPAHLKPAPEAALAKELAALAGGSAALASRAQALAADGELRLACHLIELASQASPEDAAVSGARAAIYKQRVAAESSLMAKGIFGYAARQSESSKR